MPPSSSPTGSSTTSNVVSLLRRARQLCSERARADDACEPLTQYQGDPLGFCRDVLGIRLWADLATDVVPVPPIHCATQEQVALAAATEPLIAVRSGKGVGKTRLAAALLLWLLYCWKDSIVITTATTWTQVSEQLWREVHALIAGARMKLGGRLLDTKLELGPRWFAIGLSTKKPESMQGFHASVALNPEWKEHPERWASLTDAEFFAAQVNAAGESLRDAPMVAVIVDEASGIEAALEPALEGLITNPNSRLYRFGNPTRRSGKFYDLWHPMRGDDAAGIPVRGRDYRLFTIDARTAPAAVVSREYLRRMAHAYRPNPTERAEYQIGVLGVHATSSEDMVFTYDLLMQASRARPRVGGLHLGVDIARHGSDLCVAVLLDDGRVCGIKTWDGADGPTPGFVKSAMVIRALAEGWHVPAENIHVDATGMGWGPVDILKEPQNGGLYVDAVDFGSGVVGDWSDVLGTGPKLRNRRQELHWIALRLLQEGLLCIPDQPQYAPIWADLMALQRRKETGARGEGDFWGIEPKEDFRARTGRSSDASDGLIVALSRAGRMAVRFGVLR